MSTAATMTLGDFVTEAAIYPHSKDHFNLIKECHELSLMAMCLNNTEFVTESFDLSAEVVDGLAVMTESAGSDVSTFTEKVGEKLASVGAFIKRNWTKLINAIISLYGKMIEFVSKKRDNHNAKVTAKLDPNGIVASLKAMSPEELTKFVNELRAATPAVTDANIEDAKKHLGVKNDRICRELSAVIAPPAIDKAVADRVIQMICIGVTAARQNSKTYKFHYPKFADKVFDAIPVFADVLGSLADNKSTENIATAKGKVKSIMDTVSRLHIGNDKPTADNISTVMCTLTLDELKTKYQALNDAREKIKDANLTIGKLTDGDEAVTGTVYAAISELAETMANCYSKLSVYSAAAIAAVSRAMACNSTIDLMQAVLFEAK